MTLELGSKERQAVAAWQKFVGAKVDGDFGNKTRELTIVFQKENNLEADGRVGPATLAVALKKGFVMPPVNVNPSAIETCLPSEGVGFRGYNRERNGADQFGILRTIEAVKKVGEEWNKIHPDCPLQVGDISRKGGGRFPPHASHRNGIDADFRPVRKDSQMLPVTMRDAAYDAKRTEEFVRLVRKLFPKVTIFFNDSQLISKRLTARATGHDNHLHVRFN